MLCKSQIFWESARAHMCTERGIKNLSESHPEILSKQITFLIFFTDHHPVIQLSCSGLCYSHWIMETKQLRILIFFFFKSFQMLRFTSNTLEMDDSTSNPFSYMRGSWRQTHSSSNAVSGLSFLTSAFLSKSLVWRQNVSASSSCNILASHLMI